MRRLDSLLIAVEKLNQLCFEKAISLTTSIAWGEFSYHQRVEIPGIEKNPVYGNAYVDAYIDNEGDSPKLYSNECRIAKQNLPPEIAELLGRGDGPNASRCRETDKNFYFEWIRR